MTEFWKRKNKKDRESNNIRVTLGHRFVKGDVGLEIECEGNKFRKEDVVFPWEFHQDNSLRGKDNAEYVLKKPIAFAAVEGAVTDLWKMMDEFGTKLDDSNRTSVHVHLNCQQFHFNRLAAFTALYFAFEGILTEWCGEHRVGNLFCLRAKDAPAIITETRNFIANDGNYALSDNLHYAGLNIQALAKFGSLEVRTLQGVTTPEPVIEWVALLKQLYDMSAEFNDPRTICGMFSANGPIAFYDRILGEHGGRLRQALGIDDEFIREELYQGIRMAQDICYSRDWDLFHPVDVTPDPFGRKARKPQTEPLTATGIAINQLNAFTANWQETTAGPNDQWLSAVLGD